VGWGGVKRWCVGRWMRGVCLGVDGRCCSLICCELDPTRPKPLTPKSNPNLQSCEAVLKSDGSHRGATTDRVHILFDLEQWQEAVNRAKEAFSNNQGDQAYMGVSLSGACDEFCVFARGVCLLSDILQSTAVCVPLPTLNPIPEPTRNQLTNHPPPSPPPHPQTQLLHEAEKRLKMSQRKDYYKILGVEKDADLRTVKRAYKKMAVQLHPDKAPLAERPAAEEKFKEVG
jgi:hypothetical protein